MWHHGGFLLSKVGQERYTISWSGVWLSQWEIRGSSTIGWVESVKRAEGQGSWSSANSLASLPLFSYTQHSQWPLLLPMLLSLTPPWPAIGPQRRQPTPPRLMVSIPSVGLPPSLITRLMVSRVVFASSILP